MKKLLLIAVILLSVTAFINRPGNKMKKFQFLNGSWTMKTKKGTIMESWNHSNDSTMLGESLMISLAGQSNVMENLRLTYESGNYYYISRVKGQNNEQEVKFRITSYTIKGFVAENPEHDFPKRISYVLVNTDSIHAFIDGGPSMPDKKSDFYYKRMKN